MTDAEMVELAIRRVESRLNVNVNAHLALKTCFRAIADEIAKMMKERLEK